MCSNFCCWIMGIMVLVLLACCCCMGVRLGKYAGKCGRCVYFGSKDEGCFGSNEDNLNNQDSEKQDCEGQDCDKQK